MENFITYEQAIEALKETGITDNPKSTLKYYRDFGLIPKPVERAAKGDGRGSQILYPLKTIYYINQIAILKRKGKSLSEIKEILDFDNEIVLEGEELKDLTVKVKFGEPLAILKLIEKIKEKFPGKEVIEYNVYIFEPDITNREITLKPLKVVLR